MPSGDISICTSSASYTTVRERHSPLDNAYDFGYTGPHIGARQLDQFSNPPSHVYAGQFEAAAGPCGPITVHLQCLVAMTPRQPRSHQKASRPALSASSSDDIGRLFQVEYAMEAVSHAGISLGILASDGILLAAEKKVTSKLLDPRQTQEKIFTISNDIVCVVAGVTSDANVLIDYARLACQRYEYAYGEPMPVEQLVQAICNQKQRYTQHGGMRPFGTAFLFAGWDKFYGYQLYQSDPSGNYGGWKATCIGSNSGPAQSTFKADYPEEGLVLADAKKLLVKVLGKTMETTVLTGDKLEITVLQRSADNTTILNHVPSGDVEPLIKQIRETMEA